MAKINFNAENVAPMQAFDPIPAGWQVAHITESEMKETKKGNGHYLQLVWEILDGKYKGRKVWDRLNIHNPNPIAQEIGQQNLSAICHAVGQLHVADSSMLHNQPCKIKIKVTNSADYGPGNEVAGYVSMAERGTPSSKQANKTAADDAPPWTKDAFGGQ